MHDSEITYISWCYRELPVGRDSPDWLLHQWIKAVVLDRNETVRLVRFKKRFPEERRISNRADVAAAREISYQDRIPPLLLNAPGLDEEVLKPHFRKTECGVLDPGSAAQVIGVSDEDVATVLRAIEMHRPHALIGHDASWIVAFRYGNRSEVEGMGSEGTRQTGAIY